MCGFENLEMTRFKVILSTILSVIVAQTYSKRTGSQYLGRTDYRTGCFSVAICQAQCNLEPLCGGVSFRSDWGTPQGWLSYRINPANFGGTSFDSYQKNGYVMTFDIVIRPGLLIDIDITTTDTAISNSYTASLGDWYQTFSLPMKSFVYTSGSYFLVTKTSVAYHVAPVLATDYSGGGQTYLAGTLASCVTACFRNITCNYVYFIKSQLKCGVMGSIDSSKLSNTTTATFSDFTIVQKTWRYDSRYFAYPNFQMSGVPYSSTIFPSAEICQNTCNGCVAFQYFYGNSTCFIFNKISLYAWNNNDVTLFLWNITASSSSTASTSSSTSSTASTSRSTLSTSKSQLQVLTTSGTSSSIQMQFSISTSSSVFKLFASSSTNALQKTKSSSCIDCSSSSAKLQIASGKSSTVIDSIKPLETFKMNLMATSFLEDISVYTSTDSLNRTKSSLPTIKKLFDKQSFQDCNSILT